ncbi:MAG TPA: glycerophosphodiester phosphodiesterase [Symbiobacteriaceae bacterium]|nr:glycerophosphodiester phosphodiesterase [Symbiobacteriaceae bacterium]
MPLRIGHRGAAGTHPENTMVSFHRAIELGCDGIEFDVHRTADGQLIVIHDGFLNRTTNGTGLIMSTTYDQIEALDAGSWKNPQFTGERIPTLRQLIRETPASLTLYLELKAGSVHYPGVEEELLTVLKEEGALDRVQISSFDHHALKKIHGLAPELPLGMLFADNLLDPVGLAKQVGAEALHPAWEWVTPAFVETAHAAGLKVNVWTVNLPEAIMLMTACGVDGIMSDFPDRIEK